jgi:hypothetical protein
MLDASMLAEVENSSALTAIFGGWPSFHDAEILSIHLDHGVKSPSCGVDVHVFRMTEEVDSRGHYVFRDHSIATLDFKDVDSFELDEFNHQNVLSELSITLNDAGDHKYSVDFEGIVGCSLTFKCNAISVVSVRPYTREERIAAGSVYR